MTFDHKTICIDKRIKQKVIQTYEKLFWSLMYEEAFEAQTVNLYFERPANIDNKKELLRFEADIDEIFSTIECLLQDDEILSHKIQIKIDEIDDLLIDLDKLIKKEVNNYE